MCGVTEDYAHHHKLCRSVHKQPVVRMCMCMCMSLTNQVSLRDAVVGVDSEIVGNSLVVAHSVAIDTLPPVVHIVCGPANDSVIGAPSAELCFRCPISSEPYGCSEFWYQVHSGGSNGPAPAMPLTPLTATTANINVTLNGFLTLQRITVSVWARDAAGNVGPPTVLQFEVALNPAQSVIVQAPSSPYSSTQLSSFQFDCTGLRGCTYAYALDGGAPVSLSASTTSANATSTGMVGVGPSASHAVHFPSASVSASSALLFTIDASAFNTSMRSTVLCSVDGSGSWLDVQPGTTAGSGTGGLEIVATPVSTDLVAITLSAFSRGTHVLQCRVAQNGTIVADLLPWWYEWTVDPTPPVVSFLAAPAVIELQPRGTANFVLGSSKPGTTFMHRSCTGLGDGGEHPVRTAYMCGDWSRSTVGLVAIMGLVAGVPYRLEVFGISSANVTGDPVSWTWQSAGCPTSSQLHATALTSLMVVAVEPGSPAVLWSVGNPHAALATDFLLEIEYTWVRGFVAPPPGAGSLRSSQSGVRLFGVEVGAWHSLGARIAVPSGCERVLAPGPLINTSWFEFDIPPGKVVFVRTPAQSSSLTTAIFQMNTTAPLSEIVLQYSLDGEPWLGCASRVSLGPLTFGPHTLTVRSMWTPVDSAATVSTNATYTWTIIQSLGSSVTLSVPDGMHRLGVWATDTLGRVQAQPTWYQWTVDSVPPVVVVASIPAPVCQAAVAALTCLDATPCSFCSTSAVLYPSTTACQTGNGTIIFPLVSDGPVDVEITTRDSAGNVARNVTVLSWVYDSTPPATSVTVTSPIGHVPTVSDVLGFNVSVSASPQLALVLGGTDASRVVAWDVGQWNSSTQLFVPGSLARVVLPSIMQSLPEGLFTVAVAAVDAAGNTDPAPWLLTVLTDTRPPVVATIGQLPPSLSSNTTISFTVAAQGKAPGMLLGVNIVAHATTRQGATVTVTAFPGFVSVSSPEAVTVTVLATGLASGQYAVTVKGVDALHRVSDEVYPVISFVVDSDQPVTLCSIAEGADGFLSSRNTTLLVTSTDALAGVARVGVGSLGSAGEVTTDHRWMAIAGAPLVAEFSFVFFDLAEGVHTWFCVGVDAVDNAESIPGAYTTSVVVDTVPPLIVVPVFPPRFSSTTTEVTLCVEDINGADVMITLNGTIVFMGTATPGSRDAGPAPWCFEVPLTSDGNVSISCSAVDPAGNAGVPAQLSFVLDRGPPTCAVGDTVPMYSTTSVIGFNVSVWDAESPVQVSSSVDMGVSTVFGSWTTDWAAVVQLLHHNLTDGNHSVQVTCTDAASNVRVLASWTVVDTVEPVVWWDSVPPAVGQDCVLCAGVNDSNPHDLSASAWALAAQDASNESPFQLLLARTAGRFDTSGGSCWAAAVNDTVPDGVYVVVADATDAARNRGTARVELLVDQQPPIHAASILLGPDTSQGGVLYDVGTCMTRGAVTLCADTRVGVVMSCASSDPLSRAGLTAAAGTPQSMCTVAWAVAQLVDGVPTLSSDGCSSGQASGRSTIRAIDVTSLVFRELVPTITDGYNGSCSGMVRLDQEGVVAGSGLYGLYLRSVDAAGNAREITNVTFWINEDGPALPPVLTSKPPSVLFSTIAQFELIIPEIMSPGEHSVWYLHVATGGDGLVPVYQNASAPSATGVVQLVLGGLDMDVVHR
jgi:hypothetical protein